MSRELPNGTSRGHASPLARERLQATHVTLMGDAALAPRAAANIAEWLAYLPEDCVKAMIRDGWHLTT